jgi:hypothetical protein
MYVNKLAVYNYRLPVDTTEYAHLFSFCVENMQLCFDNILAKYAFYNTQDPTALIKYFIIILILAINYDMYILTRNFNFLNHLSFL